MIEFFKLYFTDGDWFILGTIGIIFCVLLSMCIWYVWKEGKSF